MLVFSIILIVAAFIMLFIYLFVLAKIIQIYRFGWQEPPRYADDEDDTEYQIGRDVYGNFVHPTWMNVNENESEVTKL